MIDEIYINGNELAQAKEAWARDAEEDEVEGVRMWGDGLKSKLSPGWGNEKARE
jgi:hypothetical protein